MISLHFIELHMIYSYVISEEFLVELTYDSFTQLSTFLHCSKPEHIVRSIQVGSFFSALSRRGKANRRN